MSAQSSAPSHEPTVESLLRANVRFYEVFSELDFARMEAIWEKTDRVFCVHPGWQALRGYKPVLDSWKRIIDNTASITFTLTAVTGHVDGEIGIVTLYENIASRVGHERHSSTTVSTNVFGFDPNAGWLLFHHHSAHAAIPGDAEDTLLN
jgi:ketosteroid isomerase-like protein